MQCPQRCTAALEPVGGVSIGQGLFGKLVHHRIEFGIHGTKPLQVRLRRLTRRDLAGSDVRGQLGRVELPEFGCHVSSFGKQLCQV